MTNDPATSAVLIAIAVMVAFLGVARLRHLYIINSLPLLAGQRRKLVGRRYSFWIEVVVGAGMILAAISIIADEIPGLLSK